MENALLDDKAALLRSITQGSVSVKKALNEYPIVQQRGFGALFIVFVSGIALGGGVTISWQFLLSEQKDNLSALTWPFAQSTPPPL